jgi:hypothetical protein
MFDTISGYLGLVVGVSFLVAAVAMNEERHARFPDRSVFPGAIARWSHERMHRSVGSARAYFACFGAFLVIGGVLMVVGWL